MLENGLIPNSEAWYGVTSYHTFNLESVDEALLKGMLKAKINFNSRIRNIELWQTERS